MTVVTQRRRKKKGIFSSRMGPFHHLFTSSRHDEPGEPIKSTRHCKRRKNCVCCPCHYLIVNHYFSMSWFKFRNMSAIVNCVTNSLTNWLTHCCLVNLIDVTLACEDANSKLVEVVTVADVDDEKRFTTVVCIFGSWSLVIKLNFV